MALLYKKRLEHNAVIYNFNTKLRWIVIFSILLGFVLFMISIKFGSGWVYAVPVFLISLVLLFGGLGFAVVENMIFVHDRSKAKHVSSINKGEVRLEQ